jgi:IS30 family transposase
MGAVTLEARKARDARRKKAAAMRRKGLTVRAIAAELGVSHVTIVRDLAELDRLENEAIFAALAGTAPARPRRRPRPTLTPKQRQTSRESKHKRWQHVHQLREAGLSLREIAEQTGSSPATVMRDLSRNWQWHSQQWDREQARYWARRLH